MATHYEHFCPVARALEKIGDKWSLLIVRDLLHEPQRFSDLKATLGKITPRWLTQRLRELEAAGIVERDSQAGRREVWYRLSAAGRALSPVVDALFNWGQRHAMRPPQPGEVLNPELMVHGLARSLNHNAKIRLQPTHWVMQFPEGAFTVACDGRQWTSRSGETPDADVIVTTTPEIWAHVVTSPRAERIRLSARVDLAGRADRIAEFAALFGLRADPLNEKGLN